MPSLKSAYMQLPNLLGSRNRLSMPSHRVQNAPSGLPGWRIWLLGARPATLPAAVVPVLVASAAAAANGSFSGAVLIFALISSLFIQIGTNFSNDLFDFLKGADTGGRTGPVRVTQAGLLSPRDVACGAVIAYGLAILSGLYLVSLGGWPILVIGLLSIASGILYTGGPWPYGYHGLGDLFVFVFFGFVAVIGTYYLHTGLVDPLSWVISLPVALLATAILVVNNLRDIPTDTQTGKTTLAVLLGARVTRWQYTVLVIMAYAISPALWWTHFPSPWVWLPWMTLPLSLHLIRAIHVGTQGAALNRVLRGTGRLHLAFGILLALGIWFA